MKWNDEQLLAVKEFERQFGDFIHYSDNFDECWKQNCELQRDAVEEQIRIAENYFRS